MRSVSYQLPMSDVGIFGLCKLQKITFNTVSHLYLLSIPCREHDSSYCRVIQTYSPEPIKSQMNHCCEKIRDAVQCQSHNIFPVRLKFSMVLLTRNVNVKLKEVPWAHSSWSCWRLNQTTCACSVTKTCCSYLEYQGESAFVGKCSNALLRVNDPQLSPVASWSSKSKTF